MYSVYVLRDVKGKVYVGTTSTPLEVRWNNGNGYRFCDGLWETIQQYGWNSISKEVVAVGLSEVEASKIEQRLIAEFDATNPDKGYNRELGGVCNHKIISDRSREKMKSSKLGERNPNFGKHFSEEHRAKLSASNTGVKRSVATREKCGKAKEKPVNQYSILGVFLAQYESGIKAAIATGTDNRHISKVCNHKRATAGGYRWEFA